MKILTTLFKKQTKEYIEKASAVVDESYGNFIKGSIKTIAGLGATRVSEELKIKRLDKCSTCPHLKTDQMVAYTESDVCGWVNPKTQKACGCVVEIKAEFDKYRDPTTGKLSNEHCPIWNKLTKDHYKSQDATAS